MAHRFGIEQETTRNLEIQDMVESTHPQFFPLFVGSVYFLEGHF